MKASGAKYYLLSGIQAFVSEYISRMFLYLPPYPPGTKEVNNPTERTC